ncbi:NO signaling/Golgi transport ligand-binding domain-containing protein [Entophlyctis helioformis]|nr:NO signaling/Golgi transport ligand-binding domain-containing protein [Entophlyctis helioformis]
MSKQMLAGSKRPAILDRNLNKTKSAEVSLAAYAFLFSEMLQYAQKRVNGIQDLERKLSDYGYRVGIRMLELIVWRDRNTKRETRILGVLYFINTTVWKALFGKAADSLEKGTDNDDEYMISDNEPSITKFISVPRELSSLNCGAFTAGIVEAILDGCQFPARVTAHSTGNDQYPSRTTILIKFDKSVIVRDKALEAGR